MRKLLANPAEMIAHGAPRLIHNDQELAAHAEALFELTALDQPSRSQMEAIELLTLLVDNYERGHYPVPAADASSVVRFLIEEQGLAKRDLIPQFGSESAGFDVFGWATKAHAGSRAEADCPVQASG